MTDPIADPAATPQAPADPVTPSEPGSTEPQPTNQEADEPTLLGDRGEEDPKEDGGEPDGSGEEDSQEGTVPEKYEFKLDEGVEVDQETLEMFSPIFKELGLSNEKAQKLVDAYVPTINGLEEKLKKQSLDQFKQIVEGWKQDTLKDLGTDADKKLAVCAKAINKFGDDSFREALDQTGLGNHPSFVKFMVKVGETVTEDTFVDPKSPAPGQTGADKLKQMYPTMTS